MSLAVISVCVGIVGACLSVYRIYLMKKKPTYEDEIKKNSIKMQSCRKLLDESLKGLENLANAVKNSEEDIRIVESRAKNETDETELKKLFENLQKLKTTHQNRLRSYNAAKARHDAEEKEFREFETALINAKNQVSQTKNAVDSSNLRREAQEFTSNQKRELAELEAQASAADRVAEFTKIQPNEFETAAQNEDFEKWKNELQK